VTRHEGGEDCRTSRFTCPDFNTTYTGLYSYVRKHICGIMRSDEKKSKSIGVRTCDKVLAEDRKNYIKENEET
jgi:transposase-like protein